MARITVEDCIDKFESRFELVLVAANRARKLHSGEIPTVEKDNDKNTVIALREIADETISADDFKQSLVQEYQTVSPIDEEELALEFDKENLDEINESDNQSEIIQDDFTTEIAEQSSDDNLDADNEEASESNSEVKPDQNN